MGENTANFLSEDFNFSEFFNNLFSSPLNIITSVVDVVIVCLIAYKAFKLVKNTRVWQLAKGLLLLIIITLISRAFHLTILNY